MANRHISLPQVFADGDPQEWFQRFEICCTANEWDAQTKALKLPTLLEGEALAVWLDLSEADRKDYQVAKEKILAKMAPVGFVSLGDFHSRKLKPGESLSVFLHELKKLLGQAIPNLDTPTRDKLLLHQLLAGIPPNVSRQLRATGEVDDVEKVLQRAKLLMTIDREQQEQVATVQQEGSLSEVESLRQQVAGLSEQVAALTTRQVGSKSAPPICYRCNRPGHIQRNCPGLLRTRSCYACGTRGHMARDCPGNGRGVSMRGRGYPQKQ